MKRSFKKSALAFGLAMAVVLGSFGTGVQAESAEQSTQTGLSTVKTTTTETLAQVTGVAYNSQKERLYWNKVSGATIYYITFKGSDGSEFTRSTSYLYYSTSSSYYFDEGVTYTATVYAMNREEYFIVATDVSYEDRDSKYTTDKTDTTKIYYDGEMDWKGSYCTLYKFPVGPESAAVAFTVPASAAESTTAITAAPTIVNKEVVDTSYALFAVSGDTMTYNYADEYLVWEYSNNASFTKSTDGSQWCYTYSSDEDDKTPTLFVYFDDFNPGDTIYVRARVRNPHYVGTYTSENGYTYQSTYGYLSYSAYSNVVSYKVPALEVSYVTPYVTGSTVTLKAYASGSETGYQFAKKVNGKWVSLAKQTDDTYEDAKLTKNTKYTYRVRAYYYNETTKKTVYSAWKKVDAYTWAANLSFSAEAASATAAKLSWNKVSGADGYEIYRSDASGYSLTSKKGEATSDYTDYVLVKTLGSKKTSYKDKKLTKGEYYYYTIRAYRTIGGNKVYISDGDGVTLEASGISNVTQYVNASGKTVVTWDKMTGIKGYYVEKYDETNNVWTKVKTLKASATSYTFAKVAVGSDSVEYRIRPYDASSVYSGTYVYVSPSLASVTGVKATKTSEGIQVTWNAVSGADYYRVYRTTSSAFSYDATAKTYTAPSSYESVYEGNVNTTGCTPETGDDTYLSAGTYATTKITGTSVLDHALTYQTIAYVYNTTTGEYEAQETGTITSDGEKVYQTEVAYYNGVEGPEAGVTYYYYVVAYATAPNGNLNYSSVSSAGVSKPVSATYTAVKATTPKAKKVTVKSNKKGTVTITIKKNAASGADGYAIYRSTKKGSGYVLIGFTAAKKGKTTFTDSSATSGKKYYYKVASYVQSEAKANIYSSKTKAFKVSVK